MNFTSNTTYFGANPRNGDRVTLGLTGVDGDLALHVRISAVYDGLREMWVETGTHCFRNKPGRPSAANIAVYDDMLAALRFTHAARFTRSFTPAPDPTPTREFFTDELENTPATVGAAATVKVIDTLHDIDMPNVKGEVSVTFYCPTAGVWVVDTQSYVPEVNRMGRDFSPVDLQMLDMGDQLWDRIRAIKDRLAGLTPAPTLPPVTYRHYTRPAPEHWEPGYVNPDPKLGDY